VLERIIIRPTDKTIGQQYAHAADYDTYLLYLLTYILSGMSIHGLGLGLSLWPWFRPWHSMLWHWHKPQGHPPWYINNALQYCIIKVHQIRISQLPSTCLYHRHHYYIITVFLNNSENYSKLKDWINSTVAFARKFTFVFSALALGLCVALTLHVSGLGLGLLVLALNLLALLPSCII